MPPSATAPKPTPKNVPKKTNKWVWISAVAIGLIIGYFLLRKGAASANSSPQDGSGNAGGILPQSASGGASGGGSSSGPQFIPSTVSDPGNTAPPSGDTSIPPSTSPTSTSTGGYSYVNPTPGQTVPDYIQIGSTYYQQSAPGSDAYQPLPPSHPGVVGGASMLPDAFSGTNIRRPGFQPD